MMFQSNKYLLLKLFYQDAKISICLFIYLFFSFNKNINHCFLGIQLVRGIHSVLIYSACQIGV